MSQRSTEAALAQPGATSRFRRWLVTAAAAAVLTGALPGAASAASLRDLVALAQAGLSDDILIALIEADRTDFALDAPRILDLRAQGISERVILAMLRVSRERREEPPAPAEVPYTTGLDPNDGAPNLVIIGQPEPPPTPRPEVVFVPWFTHVRPRPPHVGQPVLGPEQRGFGRFMNDGWVERRPAQGR